MIQAIFYPMMVSDRVKVGSVVEHGPEGRIEHIVIPRRP